MRLFIAINFGPAVRERLLALRDGLRGKSSAGNFSEPDNLHLTLVFIGECDAAQTARVRSAMDAADFEPFPAVIARVGRFGRRGGDIWWAGVRESKPLLALQRELTERLLRDGFAVDAGDYHPHITLGREVVTGEKPWETEPFGETVSAIDLMKSERIRGKLTYTAIHTVSK
ncbi:MAG: RNA 2',3'-cyclic phosphodiesterase [Firmicutes bacterium]|nr:RNA 2',3'-cyclic phosphodiesterase [Bacillota bacterium]